MKLIIEPNEPIDFLDWTVTNDKALAITLIHRGVCVAVVYEMDRLSECRRVYEALQQGQRVEVEL